MVGLGADHEAPVVVTPPACLARANTLSTSSVPSIVRGCAQRGESCVAASRSTKSCCADRRPSNAARASGSCSSSTWIRTRILGSGVRWRVRKNLRVCAPRLRSRAMSDSSIRINPGRAATPSWVSATASTGSNQKFVHRSRGVSSSTRRGQNSIELEAFCRRGPEHDLRRAVRDGRGNEREHFGGCVDRCRVPVSVGEVTYDENDVAGQFKCVGCCERTLAWFGVSESWNRTSGDKRRVTAAPSVRRA